jgi:FkbM family methyltransferase
MKIQKMIRALLWSRVKWVRMRRCLSIGQTLRTWWMHRFAERDTPILLKLKDGTPIFLRARSSDLEVLMKVFGEREYDLPLLQEPKAILDGGANVGYASLFFAMRYPKAKIYAVEPDAANLKLIEKNCAGHANIYVIPAALWFEDTELELEDPGMEAHAYRISGLTKGDFAKKRTLARSITSLQTELGLAGFDLVKLDIEGAEREVLKDETWLANTHVLVSELHDRFVPGCSRRFYQAIHDFEGDYLLGENTIAFRRGWLPDSYIETGYWFAK